MNTNAAVKYFKLFREAHNMDNSDYVTNGEVLIWLANKLEREAEARSPKAVAARHQKSLDILDKYIRENPEEVKALAAKFGPSEEELSQRRRDNTGVHRTHCCKGHGCKYGDRDCPVVLGEIEGIGACEFDEPDSPCNPKPSTIFLIEQAWLDPMENHNATGYKPIGFVFTLEEARAKVSSGRLFTQDDCWEIAYHPNKEMQEFIYTELNELI